MRVGLRTVLNWARCHCAGFPAIVAVRELRTGRVSGTGRWVFGVYRSRRVQGNENEIEAGHSSEALDDTIVQQRQERRGVPVLADRATGAPVPE